MESINVRALPLHRPVILNSDSPLKEAAYAMETQNIGSVLVSKKEKGLVGIVTDRDLAFLLGLRGFTSDMKLIHAVSEKPLASVSDNDTLADVIKIMRDKGIRRVPLINASERCMGIISLDDLIKEGLLNQEESESILKTQLKSRKPRNKTIRTLHGIDRREHSYFKFLNHIATAANLSRGDARRLTLYTLGSFLKRITADEGKDLLSQLPYLLQAELISDISLPDPSYTTSDLVKNLSERFDRSEDETRILMRVFWRAFSELISGGEAKQVASQLPKDMRAILGT